MQKLFNRYPRRAVKKVLVEKSQAYTGQPRTPPNFCDTPTHLRSSAGEVSRAHQTCDSFDWAKPSPEELSVLASPPTKEEIAQKPKRATNTAPGADGIQYRDIIKLDSEGKLLKKLYKAVWRFGIPTGWKSARTIPIFKKGGPADFRNFQPISLLPTNNKVFSATIAS
jgi:hypothetical protein